jgi:hypothetical protein
MPKVLLNRKKCSFSNYAMDLKLCGLCCREVPQPEGCSEDSFNGSTNKRKQILLLNIQPEWL